jgi:hypothetical protein
VAGQPELDPQKEKEKKKKKRKGGKRLMMHKIILQVV